MVDVPPGYAERLNELPCTHGVRGCIGDVFDQVEPGALCARHAVEHCTVSPTPEQAELDMLWSNDGYQVLRHPWEQPESDGGGGTPLPMELMRLTRFTASQLEGNGHGQPDRSGRKGSKNLSLIHI